MEEKGKKNPQKLANEIQKLRENLMNIMETFTSKEEWDQFFSQAGTDYAIEWHGKWHQLESLLTEQLVSLLPAETEDSGARTRGMGQADVRILVPGCGSSRVSEHLYDAGFTSIINVDYSKVVIKGMLRRNVRERPMMKWRVMDMTEMQFEDQTFDVIVDKGGLDTLMKPNPDTDSGKLYLSQVKRLLKDGGRYICMTFADSHVLDLLLLTFRFWWKMSIYPIALELSSTNKKQQSFMVVAQKDTSNVLSEISSFLHEDSVDTHDNQVCKLCVAFQSETDIRSDYRNDPDILRSVILWGKGNLAEIKPGRRVKLTLGEPGVSCFYYNAVLLDGQQDSGPAEFQCLVVIVPKLLAHDREYSSKEGQWSIVTRLKAARLILILLDSSNSNNDAEFTKRDISPLLEQLTSGFSVRVVVYEDVDRIIVHQVTSFVSGTILVYDTQYPTVYHAITRDYPSKDSIFRYLDFQRTENMLQSEALLSTKGLIEISSNAQKNKTKTDSKTCKNGKQKQIDSDTSLSAVNHNYLASPYHNGIISGVMLKGCISAEGMVKTVIIGLGGGILPMFMRNCLPSLDIEVIELDPEVKRVATDYFGFREDERLTVRIGDGIRFVMNKAEDSESGKDSSKIDILIVDVDKIDPSYALTSPELDFLVDQFLLAAKHILCEQGLFIVNLVSRSSHVKTDIYARMKGVFSNLFTLELEKNVSEVIFAVKSEFPIKEYQLSKGCEVLARSLEQDNPDWGGRVIDASKKIKPLALMLPKT